MKLNVGDYVRLKGGVLGKIIDKYKIGDYYKIKVDIRNGFIEKHKEDLFKKYVVKSSPNIIDLIEVGDYVNGVLIEDIFDRTDENIFILSFENEIMLTLTNKNIKSIVTKEQFEQMEYKLED